ncbi:rod shape-determining protein MreC [Campylobacter sp. MIT 12-5580]|uniref:rod shape-determining protein MreC n=1 Tax=Campylobacter sp. MIT 12-5580 TaxID=2040651 RepID=UPI0010F6C311|nr:rod shape-determining protein MreC [Campylobacter sp. MIT 12-5580]TKX28395.1 rod shape-determining protein MreC [Campylobacter sp. MIT 12-5580]
MKNKIRGVLILSFLVFISFYYGGSIKKNVLFINDIIITTYYDVKDYMSESISEHFNQVDQIRALKAQNKQLEEATALISTFANQLNLLLEDKNSTQYLPKVSLVKAISYAQISDYNRLWLSTTHFNGTQNRGLIYQGYTAGIAILKNDRPMALLQSDEQCAFSVYIGKDKIPGVLQGNGNKVIVKFIPKWQSIHIGDEVLTSGLDNIFFSGVPVGKITKIDDSDMYQSAEIEPFVKVNIPAYMYMVERF